jgi:hypothetical protein
VCGLFGAIGLGWSEGVIRALAWANQERGTDSIGFFDSTGKMIKCAETPSDALAKANISTWLDASCEGSEKLNRNPSWFIAGHTRLATRGKVNRQNSHPFRYGRIIGSHNGMIDAPSGYVVDSQHLFDSLHKAGGDYNAAWAEITGYWAVTWFDDHAFYVQVHNGDLTLAKRGDVWYYSSAWSHLASCIGPVAETITLKEGQTLKFTLEGGVVVMTEIDKFVSSAPDYWTRKYGCSNAYDVNYTHYPKHGKSSKGSWYESHGSDATTSEVREYDKEWRDAWAEYATESEHSHSV